MDLEKYRRITRALAESKRLNAELEERVRQKQVELQRQFDAMQRLSHEAAVAEERQRIMADMHDGIGAQLISTLSLVEYGEASKDQVVAALRECIDDLRLAIDSLEPTDEDLLPVLGNLRYRLEGRLRHQGIALDWQVNDVPRLACLTPRNVLHVLRILQEAFTNVLKHAGASRICVQTELQGDRVAIRISDNGRGFLPAESATQGRGLGNMRTRARLIGAELQVVPSTAGTMLALLLPVG
jgi:signal transduction histidine kinase